MSAGELARRSIRHGLILSAVATFVALEGCRQQRGTAGAPEFLLRQVWEIGSIDRPQYSFSSILKLAPGADGRLYVAQRRIPEVWVFDEAGRFLYQFGQYGEGPGEFKQPSNVGESNDTVWVADVFQNRVSLFDRAGRFIRSTEFLIDPESVMERTVGVGPLTPRVRLASGDIVGWPRLSLGLLPKRDVAIPVMRVDEDGQPLGAMAWPALRSFDLTVRLGPGRNLVGIHPLGFSTVYAIDPWGNHLTLVDYDDARPDRMRLTRVDSRGDTILEAEHRVEPVQATDELLDRMIRQEYEGHAHLHSQVTIEQYAKSYREALGDPAPSVLPAVMGVLPGIDGTTWIRRGEDFRSERRWEIFDANGALRGTVLVPRDISLFVVSADEAWAAVEDELGVPHIRKYQVMPR